MTANPGLSQTWNKEELRLFNQGLSAYANNRHTPSTPLSWHEYNVWAEGYKTAYLRKFKSDKNQKTKKGRYRSRA